MSSKVEHQHSINASVEQAFANDELLDDEINIVVHWGFWFGVAFFSLVIIGLLSFSWFVTERMVADETAPVTSVIISGEMPYTTEVDIENAISRVELGNFFKVDVNVIQQKIAELPWVFSVSVRKNWPNELKIYVVDQTPVALWNGDFLLNQFGKAFQADTKRLQQPLPSFFGPEGSERVALDNFNNFNRLLEFKRLAIDELMLSERFSWQLILSDGVMLNLGREERIERIQRFMDIYSEIKLKKVENQQVDYIDLRYDTGLAVGWKTVANKRRA
jgi:cell division protein FtsQ